MIDENRKSLDIPGNWCWVKHEDISSINPKNNSENITDELEVSFLQMASVEEKTGQYSLSDIRPYGLVKKGYTQFVDGDLIFAKITPCMENGKIAVVENLVNGIGCGSTEFHVSRAASLINRKYLFYFFNREELRRDAQRNMTGSAGQLRVSKSFFAEVKIPLPPLAEQHRIVDKIEELFSDLDNGIDSLKKAQQQLKIYRQAVLKWAFEGKLTAQWREEQKRLDKLESAEVLLAQIKAERERRYQQELEDWITAITLWEANGKEGKRPGKPSIPRTLPTLTDIDLIRLPKIPDEWYWTNLCNVTHKVGDIDHKMPQDFPGGYPYLSTGNLKSDGIIDFKNAKTISHEDFKRLSSKIKPEKGDIIFPRYGTIGRNFLIDFDKEFLVSYSCAIIKNVLYCMNPKFVFHYSLSPLAKKEIQRHVKETTQANIGIDSIENFVFPLCSLSEQIQIIEEIESRLSICDRLEAEIETNLKKAEALRQSILKQAFEGKLVPQDPNDEPASVLLERIRDEQKQKQPTTKTRAKKNASSKLPQESASA